jgi:cathepsin L
MNKLAIFFVLLPLIFANSISLEESFGSWINLHSKKYESKQEYNYRLAVYRQNLAFVESHNRQNVGFTVAMNKFGDLTNLEFASIYNGLRVNATQHVTKKNVHVAPLGWVPTKDTVDWRTQGAVTSVKNQGQCGSCWAFSTTGSVEGAWKLSKKSGAGALVSSSEQQLVDCSSDQGNMGCDGGLMDSAFQYIIQRGSKGLDTEDSYPYTAEDGDCAADSGKFASTISSFKDVQAQSEPSLQSAIQSIGPVSVAIDASQSSFQFYNSGVYYEKYCSPTQLDHGVLAVGFGTTDDSAKKDYYIVKNSWGTDWGMQGYILMSRNKQNNCGIATMSSYPIV